MTLWNDFDCEMQRLPLDVDTADRLLAGRIPAVDAPPGYESVTTLLESLRAQREELGWQEAAGPELLDGRSPHPESASTRRRSPLHRFRLAGSVAVAALACTTGLAFAGGLPGAAQDVASSILGTLGISVPGPDDAAGVHPEIRGTSSPDHAVDARHDVEHAEAGGGGKGAEISDLATTTDVKGVGKGAAVSTVASGGTSQAGQHGRATEEHGSSSRASGEETAAEASSGHSTAAADNAAVGQSHRP